MFEAARPKGESAEFCEHERGYIRGIPLMPGFFVLLSFLAKESRENAFCISYLKI